MKTAKMFLALAVVAFGLTLGGCQKADETTAPVGTPVSTVKAPATPAATVKAPAATPAPTVKPATPATTPAAPVTPKP